MLNSINGKRNTLSIKTNNMAKKRGKRPQKRSKRTTTKRKKDVQIDFWTHLARGFILAGVMYVLLRYFYEDSQLHDGENNHYCQLENWVPDNPQPG